MRPELLTGRFLATRQRFGFVRLDSDPAVDCFVPPHATGGAFDGDRVRCEVHGDPRPGYSCEAHVLAILERHHRRFTGRLGGPRRRPYLVPDLARLPARLRLTGDLQGARPDDRVLVALEEAGDARRGPTATILTRLGEAHDARLDEEIVRAEFSLPGDYPRAAEQEAAERESHLMWTACSRRQDFSSELTVTIDPADARDHDDAVSLAVRPDGTWRLRVHIADVAEGVAPGGAIDAEARRRGNSTYLPGCMIPMLPQRYATRLLSLKAGALRPVMTLSMRLGRDGRLLGTRVEEGCVRSRAALDYDQVGEVLAGAAHDDVALRQMLCEMDRLAQLLRRRRFARGGFDLDVPETEIELDADGVPRRISRHRSGRSHQLIEEFMILGNRVACRFAVTRGLPYVFRVHPPPTPEALERFREQLRELAPEVPAQGLTDVERIRSWLASLAREPRTWQIHELFLRAMQRASYAAHDAGHYGLGLRGYGHFTSPIRRYPDLFNHRLIKWALAHPGRPAPREWSEEVALLARECTETAERSERAESELTRIKLVRWAERRWGDSFRGRVSGTSRAGIHVALDEPPVRGLVPQQDWDPAPRRNRERGGRTYGRGRGSAPTLGTPVIVQIVRSDIRERQIFFALRAAGPKALRADPHAWGANDVHDIGEFCEPRLDAVTRRRRPRGAQGQPASTGRRRGRGGPRKRPLARGRTRGRGGRR